MMHSLQRFSRALWILITLSLALLAAVILVPGCTAPREIVLAGALADVEAVTTADALRPQAATQPAIAQAVEALDNIHKALAPVNAHLQGRKVTDADAR